MQSLFLKGLGKGVNEIGVAHTLSGLGVVGLAGVQASASSLHGDEWTDKHACMHGQTFQTLRQACLDADIPFMSCSDVRLFVHVHVMCCLCEDAQDRSVIPLTSTPRMLCPFFAFDSIPKMHIGSIKHRHIFYVHTHTHMYTHVHTRTHTHVHTCTRKNTHTHTHTSKHLSHSLMTYS